MRPVKLTNLLICAIATVLFGATYVAFREPRQANSKVDSSSSNEDEPADIRARSNGTDTFLASPYDGASPMRLLQVPSYMRMLNASTKGVSIDIAGGKVDLQDLDQRTVIVTGLSGYTEDEGIGLVVSAQVHMPFKKIILYDLGVKEKTLARLRPLCNVEIRKFTFAKYPPHVKELRNNAWKLIIITDALKEFGSVFYAHPHIRFRAPVSVLYPFVVEAHGFVASMAEGTSLLDATHPDMFRFLGVPSSRLAAAASRGPIVSGDMLLLVTNSTFYRRVVPRLRKCLFKRKCLAPTGSAWSRAAAGDQRPHHFDLSALSLAMFREFGEAWAPGERLRRMTGRLYVVQDEAEPMRELSWSFRCNPPKQEFDPARLLQKKT